MPTDFISTAVQDVFEIKGSIFKDHRGAFLNMFRKHEDSFMSVWRDRAIAQVNLSVTENIGTIRGLHMQSQPHSEAKIVRCLSGKVWDVAVDLRPNSLSFGKWHAVELSSSVGNGIFIPEGCAHGFQVLEPNSQLIYLHSGCWSPEAETGVRWNDPNLKIEWPLPVDNISIRDAELPFLIN